MEYLKNTVGGLRSTLNGLTRIFVLLLAVAGGCVPAVAQSTTEFVELASVNAAGTQAGNGRSGGPQSSDDGRFVIFVSEASNLVANDTNGALPDVFVRDLQLDTTRLVSVNGAGTGSGNGTSTGASITPNGRYVIFDSAASDLVANDANGFVDVFVRDLVAQTTTLVSVNSAGTGAGNSPSSAGRITPDGRYAIFTSSADDLVAGDGNSLGDAFRRDLLTGMTVIVSVNAAGTGGGNGHSQAVAITPDGRYVLFGSTASDLAARDTNGSAADLFRRDLQTNITDIASINVSGTGTGNVNVRTDTGVMSDDGRVVAFASSATDLVAPGGDGTGFTDPSVYAHDFAADTTTLVSERQVFQAGLPTIPPSSQPRISADGRHVFYLRIENGTGPLNRTPFRDRVFRRDLQTGELLELPFVATGQCDMGFDCRSSVSGYVTSRDGRYVAYRQFEQPPVNSSPYSTAIVVRDMVGGGTEVIAGFPGSPEVFNDETQLSLEPGSVVAGGKVAFTSGVTHSTLDANVIEDVYLFAPPATPRVAFDRATYGADERGFPIYLGTIRVRRKGYLIDSTATVKFTTADRTATAGSDYVARSETLTFAPGESEKAFRLQFINDEVDESDETLRLSLSDPTGDLTLGGQTVATVTIFDDDPHFVQVSSFDPAHESPGSSFLVRVTLNGALTGPVSVDYSTADGTAGERSDYITASGRLIFEPGQTSKTVRVYVVDDGFTETDETLSFSLSNLQGANVALGSPSTQQLTILANDSPPPAANPIDNTEFFVRQHYLDFLNREPDQSGLQFWTNEIEQCGAADARCREVRRINVSAAFFLSIEFQETGFLAYLTNKAAFGTRPLFGRFQHDVQNLQRGFVFGQSNPSVLEANKRAFFDEFAARPEFVSKFGGMDNLQYVNTLLTENGLAPTVPNVFVSRLEGQTPSQPGTTPPGVFILRRDPSASNTTVRLSLRLNTLSSAPTAVHIHGPVTNGVAPILYTLPAGEFADLQLTLTNEQIGLLNGGQLTVDVHTQNNPGGELTARLGPIRFRVDVLTGALNDLTLTRAEVLRVVAESEELRRAEFNAAFVLMEYFGYLRRDPDPEGYAFWLSKLNQFNGDFIQAEMVKAFISSAEYRQRFGQ